MNDTTPEVTRLMADRIAAMSGAQRVFLATSHFDSVRALVLASLGDEPDPAQRRVRLLCRLYPECAHLAEHVAQRPGRTTPTG